MTTATVSGITIREATSADAGEIAGLVGDLGDWLGEPKQVSTNQARTFLSIAGNGALLAEKNDEAVGLITYTVGWDLYHAGECCVVREMFVAAPERRKGIGSRLIDVLLSIGAERGWREISVTTLRGRQGARRFYKKVGFRDEALWLERHLDRP